MFNEYRKKNQHEKNTKWKIKEQLKINTLESKLTNNRIRLYEHILRTNKDKIAKKVQTWK